MNKLHSIQEYLVPFTAKHVTSQVLWNNDIDDIVLEELRLASSYLIERGKHHSVFNNEQLAFDEKVFYAERYGGVAISHNGGGARCGFDGRWQVKGIGANALVGIGSKQVNGELTLIGAILEVLWGSLMAKLLPYGAVPNLAVLLTECPLADSPTSITVHNRRSLLVRVPVIRPAHFCRAPYYQPHAAMNSQPADAARVEKLIANVPEILPQPDTLSGQQWCQLTREERSLYGLCELSRRLATQIAYCRTRHLVMMTSPSNCDMYGRLLDFHGVRSVFPGDRQQGGRSYIQHNKLNEDAPLLLQGVQDLGFYLAKYQFGQAFLAEAQHYINLSFDEAFRQTCWRENLGMAGFDDAFLRGVTASTEYIALGERLQQILDMSAGIFTQRQGVGQGDAHPAIALLHRLIDASISAVTPNIATVENRFFRSFHQLCAHYFHYMLQQGINTIDVQNTMKNTVSRRLQSRAFMNREVIYREISGWQGDVSDIAVQLQDYQCRFENQAVNIFQ
jgi:hypothetical protein